MEPSNSQLSQDFLQPSSLRASGMQKPHILQVAQSSQAVHFQPIIKNLQNEEVNIQRLSKPQPLTKHRYEKTQTSHFSL